MKIQFLPFAALFSLCLPFVSVTGTAPSAVDGSLIAVDDDETPLGECMDAINKAMRGMRRKIGDPANYADCLKALQTLQEKAIEAKKYEPIKLAEFDGDEAKAEFLLEYRQGMQAFVAKSFELEVALLKGDVEATEKAYKALGGMKKTGHKQFKGKKKD